MILTTRPSAAGASTDSAADNCTAVGFYASYGKRIFDVCASGLGLVLLSPIFLLCAACVKASSCGPVFFIQNRTGLGGRPFPMYKFRTMRVGADREGSPITRSGDSRILPMGRWLRKAKLDELPQLWNVLKGDMSLVGPRPEVPEFTVGYTSEQRSVFAVRPGITDPASIYYRDEEQVLARASDPDYAYRNVVLPHKLQLGAQYIRDLSLGHDLRVIFRTLVEIVNPRERV